jgi:uncharacterized protein (DUF2225 family)
MTMTGPLDLTCPCCGLKFKSWRLLSCTTTGKYTDFGLQPGFLAAFWVHTCAGCGFTGPAEWFKGRLPSKLRGLVRSKLIPLSPRDAREDAWLKYDYTAQIARWKARPPEEVADYYLEAAYLCAASGPRRLRTREMAYRKKAIEFFAKALKVPRVPEESIAHTAYLIGELHRRVGSKKNAVTWLRRAERLASRVPNLDWLAKLALQQRTRPRNLISTDGLGGR